MTEDMHTFLSNNFSFAFPLENFFSVVFTSLLVDCAIPQDTKGSEMQDKQ